MPFPANGLSAELVDQLNEFFDTNDFPELYQTYAWDRDIYANEFENILSLELQLKRSERTTGVTIADVIAVMRWGRNYRNATRVARQYAETHIVLARHALSTVTGTPQASLEGNPSAPLHSLTLVDRLGPTYQSKVLRFALPSEYGAIDTWIVRVFGNGDPISQRHQWLGINAQQSFHNGVANGWCIPETQNLWPDGFMEWTNILRHFSERLNNAGIQCPHPRSFSEHGLRQAGVWTCADVEMALFSYAIQQRA